MNDDRASSKTDFLLGGGEMGERMRALDWSATALGPPAGWPQSLRSPLSMLLPSKAQIILFWGPEFVVFYNDAYRPVFGGKHPQVLGKPGRAAWSEIWDGILRDLLLGVVRTGEAFWAKDLLFVLERHGFLEETYFDVSYDPVRDESGGVGGVFCIVAETTGRVVGERRLALLRELASRNASARTTREACELSAAAIATDPEDVPFAEIRLDGVLQAATAQSTEPSPVAPHLVRELSIPGGTIRMGLNPRRPFDASYASFLDLVAGQVAAGIANAEAYETERRRAESLAELDRAKTLFFSNVSHEFRTPLTLLLGPIAELLERTAEGADRAALELVQRNAERLLKLVNTLLEFARIEAGRAEARFEPVELGAYTGELASAFRSACERAGLALSVDCPPLPEPVYVDRSMWEKVVLNLLSNAFKFTARGGIEVRLGADGGRVRLTVRDTGIGIPPEELPRLFERFHRVEGARGRSHEGSGIGLALVQELVRLLGGSVAVESTLGRGSTFVVEIPRGSAHLAPWQIGAHGPETAGGAAAFVGEALSWLPSSTAGESRAGAPSHAPRVLVADDNADLRAYAARLLGEAYEVRTVGDGRQALEAMRSWRPDLLVADVMMPELDGFGLVREIRSDAGLRDLPVLMLSARAGEESRLEGLGRGADDYLAKPFAARELLVRCGALVRSAEIRRRSTEELRQSSLRFKTLLDEAPLGIYLLDSELRLCEANPVARPMFAGVDGDGIGREIGEILRLLLAPAEAAELERTFRRTLETGEPYVVAEAPARLRPRGEAGFYEWTIHRIPLPDGKDGIVCYFRDITAQVTARKALEQSREALREADRRKDEFLATLSHELRNPLAPLRNAVHLLAAGSAVPLERVTALMERQVNHLVRLVDDLLEVSRITRGVLELRREVIELSSVIRNAIETSEPLIQEHGHRLEVSSAGEPLWLEGDPVRLAQIVANLLNNAARYSPSGGRISLTTRRDGDQAEIRVRDSGRGIAPENLERVFEMFMREERPGARAAGGLGIGLTLSRRLAEMHGGSISARSEGEGQGAEFVVCLPLTRERRRAAGAGATVRALPSALRVLLVDDNCDAAESLALVLSRCGARVRQAHDGAGAIAAAAEHAPDVVLLDIGLPDLDGYEVARRVAEQAHPSPPVLVALTGWGQEEHRRLSRTAGIAHHLVKPVDVAALLRILEAIVPRRPA